MEFIERKELLPKPPKDHKYVFGALATDYMFEVDWDINNGGWQKPKIKPNEPFELDPANATLHYSIECFEGLKAYRSEDGRALLFRPRKTLRDSRTLINSWDSHCLMLMR